MSRPRSSRLGFLRPGSSHLIKDLVDRAIKSKGRPHLVHWMIAGDPLAEEDALLPELEFDRGPGHEAQPLSYLDRHGNLPFGGDRASHG
jgi:hypothetical protein